LILILAWAHYLIYLGVKVVRNNEDKEETFVHSCPKKDWHDMLRVDYFEETNSVVIRKPGEYGASGIYGSYCPFCGRHAEEIALEFVDDEDLEVAEDD